MRKKLFTFLLALAASTGANFAYDFKSGNLCYNILSSDNHTVEVTHEKVIYYQDDEAYYGLDTVVIPSVVSFAGVQYHVTTIGQFAFSYCDTIESLTIPPSVVSIEVNAFGKTIVKEVHISDLKQWCEISFPSRKNYYYYGDDGYTSNPLHLGALLYINDSLLTELVIPESVTSIGSGVFNNYRYLTSVTFHDGITNIGAGAFKGCKNISTLEIPQNVTNIGKEAFLSCDSLTTIVWNAKQCTDFPYYIGEDLIFSGKNITSFTLGNTVEYIPKHLCNGMKNLKSIEIPSSVTSIGDSAFYNCDSLETVLISDMSKWCSINFKGFMANPLYYANNLLLNGNLITNLNIPSNITTIGNYAFYNFSNLQSVRIGNSVTKIGTKAFYNCTGLTSVNIPIGVTNIGFDAFYHVLNINYLGSASGEPWGAIYCNGYAEGDFVYSDNSKQTLVACSYQIEDELVIPEGVTSIGSNVVSNKNINKIIVPSSVTSISSNAFNWNNGSNYIEIKFLGDTPATLGNSPFPYQTYYFSLRVPCGTLEIYKEAWSSYSNRIFEYKTHVQTSITPQNSGYISIPDSASECRSYTIKAMPNAHWHFIGWSDGINDSIREIDGAIDTTLTAIFEKDRHSVEITTEDSIKGITKGSGEYDYGEYVSIEALPEYGYHFSHWSDKDAEYNSQVPEDAISASTARAYASQYGSGVSSSQSYTIVGYIVGTYNGYYSAYDRSYLLSDTPDGSGDFVIFKAQNSATIGSYVKVTDAKLYNYNGTYETLQNTGTITKITQKALENPRKFYVTQDTTLTAYFAPNKYKITLKGENGEYTGAGEFDYKSSCTITAQAEYGYSFTQWSDGNTDNPRVVVLTQDTTFTAQYEYITSGTCGNNYVLSWSYDRENTTLTISGNGALDEHYTFGVEAPRNMTKLVIEDGVTNIGSTAFDYCYSLTSVTIPNSVTSIGNSAFEGCRSLTSVTIPNSVTSIGNSAFEGCRSLTSVTIPNSVTNIGQSAFEGCRSLTSVEIPSSVTNVGNRAFANCPLEKVYWGVADQVDYAKEEFSSVGIKVGLDASNLNWSSVYLYAWTNSGTTVSAAWPGTKVNVDESGLYTYTFSSSYSTINIIWNNGTDQTMDITNVSTSGIYTLTSSSGTNISYNTRPFEGKSLSPFVNSTANISEFTIGENVTRIPALLCEGAGNLTELTIPNSVTAIGESAFDGCSALTTLTLGENITSYGTNAFAGCSSLTSIYNYRERPAKLGANTFDGVDYFNCTLYVLANSVNMYKSSGSDWKDFYFVEPIGATSTTTDEVVVTPHDNTADIVWPTISGAASYELEIKDIDGNLICTLIFNANGQLTSLAFHAPARNNAPQQAQTAGFQFTITGLEIATRYTYTMQVKDASSQVIAEYSGTFGTTGAPEIPTGINNISTTNVSQKIMSNGQIFILRGEKVYTITGQEVK